MAQRGTDKRHRLNDQSADPKYPYERWAGMATTSNPSTKEAELGSLGQAHKLDKAETVNAEVRGRPCPDK